jgi:hypothetical protein
MHHLLRYVLIASLAIVPVAFGTSPASAEQSLAGTYAVTLTIDDVKLPAGSGIPAASMAGEWTITFGADHTYSVRHNNAEHVTGTFTLKGDELELNDTAGDYACKGGDAPQGIYRVRIDGPTVTFTKLKDEECPGRVATMTPKPFQLVK